MVAVALLDASLRRTEFQVFSQLVEEAACYLLVFALIMLDNALDERL